MERDCMISHGAASMLRDRLCEQSDYYETFVCTKCGFLAEPAKPDNVDIPGMTVRAQQPYCRNCRSTKTVKRRAMTYAFKLLCQELMSMNMGLRLENASDLQAAFSKGLRDGKEIRPVSEFESESESEFEGESDIEDGQEYIDDLGPESEWPEQENEVDDVEDAYEQEYLENHETNQDDE